MWYMFFCFVAIISYVESASDNVQKIVGGKDVKNIKDAPYQVSLSVNRITICGGAIIARDIVLTAAHCFNRSLINPRYSIRAGSESAGAWGKEYQVHKYIIHPSYSNKTYDYDIAVLYFQKKLTFSSDVAAIEMKNKGEQIPTGEMCTVTGWGYTKEQGHQANLLQMVHLPKISDRSCKAYYKDYVVITTRMFCAGYQQGKKDACKGDSGGPLVHDNKLGGLVSFGIGCARPNLPGVYARISTLRNWIDQIISKLRGSRVMRKGEFYSGNNN